MPREPDGYTIFCDDIRAEQGNKFSLMGIYRAEMLVHQPFPVTVPKLGFYVVHREDPTVPLHKMQLRIYVPGDPDDKPSYSADVEPMAAGAPPQPPAPDTRRTFLAHVLLNGVVLKEEGRIRVRMHHEDKVVKLGSLRIKHAPQPQQQT
jgi:Family of unknown function (DUF6941)